MEKKNSFTGKIGFVMAAASSAVGLGNLWRFPYLAAKYGGAGFLIMYLLIAVTFGFTLLITEIAIGRKTGKSALYAFSSLNKKYKFIGILASIVPILILPYYCVIGGWVIKYTWVFLSGEGTKAAQSQYFETFTAQTAEPVLWLAVFIILTAVVILMGVTKGIEKISKILMPILIVLLIIVAGFVISRPNALDGVAYYLKPDWSKMSVNGFLAALGQVFYSMSLAMGIMITYGSYLPRKENIESSVKHIEIFDSGVAFLGGLMIVPAVFVFSNGDENALQAGPKLMFVTLPKVFESMPAGRIVGTAFFLLVLFAALTSAISLMETVVAIFVEKTKKSRRIITLFVTVYTVLMAIPSSLGFGIWSGISFNGMSILDTFDFLTNSILMPVVALFTCIFVGFVVKPKTVIDEVKYVEPVFKREKMYVALVKYVAPVFLLLILISSVLNAIGVITL